MIKGEGFMNNNLSNHDYIALEVGKLMKTVQYIE